MRVPRELGIIPVVWFLLAWPALAAADGAPGGDLTGDGSAPLNASGGAGSGDFTNDPNAFGGAGGNGGSVTIDTVAPVAGDIFASANGGQGGGSSQVGGNGGNGGTINITVDEDVSGGLSVQASGGLGGYSNTYGFSSGGNGGSISIVVDAHVGLLTGTTDTSIIVYAEAGPAGPGGSNGTIDIILEPGAVVDGLIASPRNTGTLTFRLELADAAALAQSKLDLATPGTQMVVINGQTYIWSGLTVIDELTLKQIVEAVIARSSASDSSLTPKYLSCRPRTVIAYVRDAETVFNARRPGVDGYFSVGRLADDSFTSTNPIGWTVATATAKGRKIAKVLDGNGAIVSTCKL